MEHDVAGLRDDLGRVAYRLLHAVDAGIDGYLADAEGAADDMTCVANTVERHFRSLDNDLAAAAVLQRTVLVHIADNNLGCGDDDALLVAVEGTAVDLIIYVDLDLLDLGLLLAHFFNALIHALLEIVEQFFPIIEYVCHLSKDL